MGAFKSSKRVAQDPPRGPGGTPKRPKSVPRGAQEAPRGSQEAPHRAIVLLGVPRRAHGSPPDL